jgi:predicted house-cleaning noncanonical NTP pyrophosphatase (MazG superfamily)
LVQNYNKAVRDRIPEIIKNSGKKCKVITLSDDEFLVEIEKKLSEEVKEYLENKSEAELADILEVVYRIAQLRGLKQLDLEKIRKDKALTHGAFSKNYFLTDTT